MRIADVAQSLPCSDASRVGYAARFAASPLTRPARGTERAAMSAMRTRAIGAAVRRWKPSAVASCSLGDRWRETQREEAEDAVAIADGVGGQKAELAK